MIPEKFKDYYFAKIDKIESDYGLASVYFDAESIHRIRVEIKKLRAFHNLIGWINPTYKIKKNFGKARQLFKALGKIRDIQVQIELARKISKDQKLELSEFHNYLKCKELRARKILSLFISRFKTGFLRKLWNNTEVSMKNIDPTYLKYKSEKRLNDLVEKLINLKNRGNLSTTDLHKVRILSKETRYTLEILEHSFFNNDFYKTLNEDLRNLHRPLGKLHDAQIGLEILDKFIGKYARQPFFDGDSYLRYSSLLRAENKMMLEIFKKGWTDFKKLLRLHDFGKDDYRENA